MTCAEIIRSKGKVGSKKIIVTAHRPSWGSAVPPGEGERERAHSRKAGQLRRRCQARGNRRSKPEKRPQIRIIGGSGYTGAARDLCQWIGMRDPGFAVHRSASQLTRNNLHTMWRAALRWVVAAGRTAILRSGVGVGDIRAQSVAAL